MNGEHSNAPAPLATETVVKPANLHDLRRDICTALIEWRDAGGPVQGVALAIDELIQWWTGELREENARLDTQLGAELKWRRDNDNE